jgi:hypothetical protein
MAEDPRRIIQNLVSQSWTEVPGMRRNATFAQRSTGDAAKDEP